MCKDCCKKGSCTTALVAKVLVVIGGINWGLVGLGMLLGGSGWNVVNMILGSVPVVEALVYVLVGVSAVVLAFGCRCKTCDNCKCEGGVCVPKDETPAPAKSEETQPAEQSTNM